MATIEKASNLSEYEVLFQLSANLLLNKHDVLKISIPKEDDHECIPREEFKSRLSKRGIPVDQIEPMEIGGQHGPDLIGVQNANTRLIVEAKGKRKVPNNVQQDIFRSISRVNREVELEDEESEEIINSLDKANAGVAFPKDMAYYVHQRLERDDKTITDLLSKRTLDGLETQFYMIVVGKSSVNFHTISEFFEVGGNYPTDEYREIEY